ncbi:MAG TPA: trigger factor [Lachnospiraceae bacterium]|nr:trigger factor [Lachnospiraceae bacterium]
MKKKLCSIMIVVLCLSLLAGCGSKKSDSKKASSDNPFEAMKERYVKEVTLAEYKGVKYTPTKTEVTDNDIEGDKASLINQGTTTEEIKTGIATYGDAVNIDYVGYVDGVAFEKGSTEGKGTQITLGSSGYIDNFDEQIVGHKPGDSFDVNVTFPDPYENNPDLAGKPAVFETTLNSIVVTKTPEYNDELVAKLTDYKTTAEYEEAMRKSHEEYNAEADKNTDKQNVITTVINNSKIAEYPKEEMQTLIDSMIGQIKELAEANSVDVSTLIAYYYGFQTEDELKDYITDYVKEYIRQRMVMSAIADAEGITVTEDEVAAKKQEIMTQYNLKSEDEIKDYYSEEDIYYVIAADKVMNLVYENAVVDDGTESDPLNDVTTETSTEAAE